MSLWWWASQYLACRTSWTLLTRSSHSLITRACPGWCWEYHWSYEKIFYKSQWRLNSGLHYYITLIDHAVCWRNIYSNSGLISSINSPYNITATQSFLSHLVGFTIIVWIDKIFYIMWHRNVVTGSKSYRTLTFYIHFIYMWTEDMCTYTNM